MNTNGSLFDFFNTKKLHIPIQHDDGCRAWLIMYGKFRDYLIFAIAFKSKIIGFSEIISLSFFKKLFKLQKWLTHIKKNVKNFLNFGNFFVTRKKRIYTVYTLRSPLDQHPTMDRLYNPFSSYNHLVVSSFI